MARKRTDNVKGELASTINDINKTYGNKVVASAKQRPTPLRYSTGIFMIDFATLGGIPIGRSTQLLGERSAGKSTIACKIIAAAQKANPDLVPIYCDIEGTLDQVWAEAQGVNLDNIQVVETHTGEMAVDIIEAVARSKETGIIVIDSLAMLTPTKELEATADAQQMGLQARLIGRLVRKLTNIMVEERRRNHLITPLFINQYRMSIGTMFGDPRIVPGGRVVEHLHSLNLELRNKEIKGKDADDIEAVIENEHAFTIKKNKQCNGVRLGEFRMARVEGNGLMPGDPNDVKTMISYAKKFGLWTGGGKNQKLTIDDDSWNFGTMDQCVLEMNEDHKFKNRLRNRLIAMQAKRMGQRDEFVEWLDNQLEK